MSKAGSQERSSENRRDPLKIEEICGQLRSFIDIQEKLETWDINRDEKVSLGITKA